MELYNTFDDMGEVPSVRSWSALRALRSSPPERASSGARRKTFSSALEQAEQLFDAAAAVGIATQPILAFYGLSQAGRAIAAAYADGDKWRLTGHGITSGETVEHRLPVADLTVRPEQGGSFGRIAEILSSRLPEQVRIGNLWPLLTPTSRHPLPGSGDARFLTVHAETYGWGTGIPTVRIDRLPAALGEVGQEHRELLSGVGADWSAQADAVDKFLSRYPTLGERIPFRANGQPIGLAWNGDNTCSINFRWPDQVVERFAGPHDFCLSIANMIRGGYQVHPSLDGGNLSVHPLTAWWAVLYRLSMLARYEPHAWELATDVSSSADAVPIEHLLETAFSTVPELIYHVLRR